MGTFKGLDRSGLNVSSVEVSESVVPSVEYRPAPWLPVSYFDTRLEDWIVIGSGTPVTAVPFYPGLEIPGVTEIVPAGLAVAVRGAPFGTTNVFAYTADDVAAGTISVITGLPVATPGDVTAAALGFGGTGLDIKGSYPIGFATYNCLSAVNHQYINYEPQARVAVTCDCLIEVPVLGGEAVTSGSTTTTTNVVAGDLATVNAGATNINTSAPTVVTINGIQDAGAVVVTLNTLTFSVDVTTADAIVINGVSTAAGATPILGGLPVYDGGAYGAQVAPGGYVKVNASSNYAPWVPATDKPEDIIGQVIGIDHAFPKDFLERVRTWYSEGTVAKTYRGFSDTRVWATPGSATGGLSDRLYRALGTSFSGTVKINVLK